MIFDFINKKSIMKVMGRIEYWFPIVLLILINPHYLFLKDVLSNILLALLLYGFARVLKPIKNFYPIIDIIFGIFFIFLMGIQIGHFYLFGGNLRASTFFIVFDSNHTEALDFIAMYLDVKLLLLFCGLLLSLLAAITLRVKNRYYQNLTSTSKKLRLFLVTTTLVLFCIKDARRKIFPYAAYSSFVNYSEEKIKFDVVTQDRMGGQFTNVHHISQNDDEVYVLVIGESTTRRHMQLYNYERATNPKLRALGEELLVYKDVISPHTTTLESLNKALTLASFDSPQRKYDGTIIQLFNRAGFKTFWISNQRPVGIFDTETTIIAKNCNQSIFVGTQSTREMCLDERVLSPMEKILKTEKGKKLIVLHLMGTHGQYRKRYPKAFDVFDGEPAIRFKSKKAFRRTNQYDNAVLYNDYIISEVIKKVKQYTSDKSAFVLYFSDHGEELYESIDMGGHDSENCTQSMYDIPFVLWRSEKYKTTHTNFVFDINRPYSTENLLYTLSDLSEVRFKEFDDTKSVVNSNFQPKKRYILDGVDYDEHFNKKN